MAIQQVDLVGNSGRPVVTPQATEQLTDAFRKGFVTADDIMERVSERTRAKQELELVTANQGIAEATDPALIQAKQNQQLLAGEQAKQQRDLLPLARRATEEKLFGDINSGQIQRYGLKEKLAALNELGFAPSPDPQKGITPEFAAEVNKNFSALLRWQKDKADAKFELASIKKEEIDTGRGVFAGPTDLLTGAPLDPKQVDALRTRAAKTLPEFLRDTPAGGVVAPIVVQPAAPLIQPLQPVAQALPVIQPTGVPPGFTQVKPAPVIAGTEKRTDALQRELVNVDLTKDKIALSRTLAVPGIVGPGQIGLVQGMHQAGAAIGIPGEAERFTAQRQLSNTIAGEIAEFVRDWKGAISDKELKFFESARPSVDSTPELWKKYLDTWEDKNERVRKIISGQLDPAEPDVWAANPKSAGSSAAPATAVVAPVALPATPAAVPVFGLTEAISQPSGTIFKDANGNWRRKL